MCACLFLSHRCVRHCLLRWGWWEFRSPCLWSKVPSPRVLLPCISAHTQFYISPSYIQKKLNSLLYFPFKFSAVSNGSWNKIAIIKQGMLCVLFVCFVFIIHMGKSCHVLEISDFKSVAIYIRKGFIIFSFETFYAALRSCWRENMQ